MPDWMKRFMFWHRSSLAAATALRVLIFGVGLGLVFSLAVYIVAQRMESTRLLENISGLVSTVESTARVACFTQDQTLAKEVATGLLANRTVTAVRITSGSTVLAEVHKRLNATNESMEGTTVTRKMSSPFNEADIVGEVVLVADDEYIREQAGSYSLFIVIVSLFEMLIIALVVAWIVLRTIVGPIREFSGKLCALKFEIGDSVSYPAGNETNEVGHLADAFNKLLGHLFALVRHEQELSTQLADKESQFRALAENSPNLIVRYDLDCRRIYCNPAYESSVGVSLNTTPDHMWRASNLTAKEFQILLRYVIESCTSANVLIEWEREGGRLVSNDFQLVPERDANGRVSSVLAIGHDISELKKQQRLDMDRSLVYERMVRGGELPEVLAMVAGHVGNSFKECQCAILLLDENTGRLRVGAASNLPDQYCRSIDEIPGEFPVAGDALVYWTRFELAAADHGLQVCLREPVLNSQQRLLGILLLYQEMACTEVSIDLTFMRQACSLAAIAIERNYIEQLVQRQASYDALTDLPNRRMFIHRLREEIARANRQASNVSLLFIDLDRFKNVNDTLGHDSGDLLLVQAALRIRSCMRESDTVARLGGDEFVVVISDVADISVLGRVAKNIADKLSNPFEINGNTAYISASIGIASYPSDTDCSKKLVSFADQAMYAAKEAGRNGFQFYSEELSTRANERLALELDLRHGIAHGELELYYQPKIDLADGSLAGSEALLRWNHPQRGVVPPDKFIGIAEDTGLIVELGEWVLRAACRTASEWNSRGNPLHKLAINLSARQFQCGNLYKTVCGILEETRCHPEWIELEITESLLLEEGGDVLTTLENFQKMGITIAIDDFGTGYSALSYLARFPINTLKIDKSFTKHVVDNGYHAELVKAIISIAYSLNQQVVAEGVETHEQAAVLRMYGCHVAQGYLYSKPIKKSAFESLPLSFAQDVVA